MANLNTVVIYHRILTLKGGTMVNYCGIFIKLVPKGNRVAKYLLIAAILFIFSLEYN